MTNAEVHDFVEVYEYLAGEGGNLHVLLFFEFRSYEYVLSKHYSLFICFISMKRGKQLV